MMQTKRDRLLGLVTCFGIVCAAPSAVMSEEATDDLDQQLLDELDAGEVLPDDVSPADETAGSESDPITRIGRKMRQVESLLEAKKQSARTRALQAEIVQALTALIEQVRKQQKQSSSGGASQRTPQKGSRDRVQQSRVPKAGKPGSRDSKRSADDSEKGVRRSKTSKVDVAELEEVIKAIWGHLPEQDRERLRQASSEEVLPDHEVAIERYFRHLAEEASR